MFTNTPMSLKLGKYRHYKGGEYRVLGVAKHSETHEELVVYVSLKDGGLWVRPLDMFLEEVDVPEYQYKGPRFSYLGEA